MPVQATTRPLADLIRADGIPEATARRWTQRGLGLTRNGHGVEVVAVDEWRRFVQDHRQAAREQALTPAGDVRTQEARLLTFEDDVAEVRAVAAALGVRARFVEPYVVRLGLAALKQRTKNGEPLDALAAEVTA